MKIFNWFDNIKLPIKMTLIAVLALIGLAIPSYYFTQLSIDGQASDRTELLGITPAQEMVQLNKLLAEHRGMSARLFGGDLSVDSALSAKANEIERQFNTVRSAVSKAADAPSLLSNLSDLESEWKSIRSAVVSRAMSKDDSFARHSQIISDGGLLISNILKYFLLSYDPAAASYHIIIGNFENLPRLTDALGKVRGSAAGALAAGSINATQRGVIQGHVNSVETPIRSLDYNVMSAAEVDPRFINLRKTSAQLETQIKQLNIMVQREVLDATVLTYPSGRLFDEYTAVINELYSLNDKSVSLLRTVIEERVAQSGADLMQTLTTIGVLFLIALFIGFVIIRSILSSTRNLVGYFSKISKGDYNIDFNTDRKDEMGLLESELAQLTQQLKDAAVVALEASKVKQALDASSTAFMMSNENREIVYMNDSVQKLLKDTEASIKEDLPNFSADNLIGVSIDSFHKDPSHQHRILDSLKTSHEARLKLGGRSFRLLINPITDDNGVNMGNSVEWHDMTEIYEEERRTARILESLDSASTNIMIADAKRTVIYMNRSMLKMMKLVEPDLRKELPHFNADDIIGNGMDRFHKNPAHQSSLLDQLTDTYVSEIQVGTLYFRLTTNPIFSEKGERLGTVVEWLDRTREVNAEQDIAQLVDASVSGDFTRRIEESGKEGFMLTMTQGLNKLMKTTETGLNEVSKVLLALSEGDLTQRISGNYQGLFNDLKTYCNTTSENLADIIQKIREASDTINNASAEIAQGNSDLSTRTEQQASSLEETASSMEEITSTTRLNAENANQANGLASKAAQVAGNGGELIQEVVATMASINESSQKIADIIGVIDGIAFQTNILALNAAVEAARAGEQGRGFAVVASEVRTLAQRSANAAKDIKDLISDSVSKVESGNTLVNQSGDTMKEIVVSIQRVNDIMSEIAAASAEQASGIDEVSKAVTQMDEMTQQNAALVEEAAAAAESMRTQAGELQTRVDTFKLDENEVRVVGQADSKAKTATKSKMIDADPLSMQFEELPSVSSVSESRGSGRKALPAQSDEDEWESF